jgi:hypothetical protein
MGKILDAFWTSLGVDEPTFHGSSKAKRIDFILQYKFAGPQASSHTACIPSIPEPAGSSSGVASGSGSGSGSGAASDSGATSDSGAASVLDLRTLSDHYPDLTDIQLR